MAVIKMDILNTLQLQLEKIDEDKYIPCVAGGTDWMTVSSGRATGT